MPEKKENIIGQKIQSLEQERASYTNTTGQTTGTNNTLIRNSGYYNTSFNNTPTTTGRGTKTTTVLSDRTAYKPLGLVDLNGDKIGQEYKFLSSDLNIPRGGKNYYSDYVASVQLKETVYTGIYDKTNIETQIKAVKERLYQIASHLSLLKYEGTKASLAAKTPDDIAESINKIAIQIMRSIPLTKTIGIVGSLYYANESRKEKLEYIALIEKINNDVLKLGAETSKLNTILDAMNLKKSLPNDDGTGIDTQPPATRSTLLTATNLGLIAVVVIIIYLYFKNRS